MGGTSLEGRRNEEKRLRMEWWKKFVFKIKGRRSGYGTNYSMSEMIFLVAMLSNLKIILPGSSIVDQLQPLEEMRGDLFWSEK